VIAVIFKGKQEISIINLMSYPKTTAIFSIWHDSIYKCIFCWCNMLVKISISEAQIIKRDLQKQIIGIDQFGIFLNNIKVTLGMFVPGFGIELGVFSAFST
jgi:hypothetical protein